MTYGVDWFIKNIKTIVESVGLQGLAIIGVDFVYNQIECIDKITGSKHIFANEYIDRWLLNWWLR